MSKLNVVKVHSKGKSPRETVAEIRTQIGDGDFCFLALFCSATYDTAQLGDALKANFTFPVMCCTTAGELGPNGYDDHSCVGFAIRSEAMKVFIHKVPHLSTQDGSAFQRIADSFRQQLDDTRLAMPAARAFGFLLVDGLSVKEEEVTAGLFAALDGIPIIGGSAGDDLTFTRTEVYCDGAFASDCAAIAFFVTPLPFEVFKTQHFVPSSTRLLVTQADPHTRIVHKINGQPAAQGYAQAVGVSVDELGPNVYSKHPVMVKIDGDFFVRSIQKRNPDDSLSFYCAIDRGVILTLGTGVNILENLESTLQEIEARINSSVIIGCECILRRLEVIDRDLAESMSRIMARHNVIGFHTYGEQINSVHVNQTFTGVAIGEWL